MKYGVVMIRLNQLCERLGRGLHFVGDTRFDWVQLTGVHISELDDPTPYLEGGELLLTTGIPFGRETDIAAYVNRLATRNVAALGLGLGAGTDAVPGLLRDACAASGLPLLVVPEGTPFLHISRAYWDLVGKTAQADAAASLTLQTSLAQAATRPEAVSAVVKVLAQALGGWAAYLPADGSAETVWPDSQRHVLPQLREETKRLDLAGMRAAASFALAGADVLEYSIIDGSRTAGFLAVCAGSPLRAPDRQLIATGTMLLAVTAQREWQATRANSIVSNTAATLIVSGFVDAARLIAADLTGAPLAERIQLLAIRGDNVEGLSVAEVAEKVSRCVSGVSAEKLRRSIRQSRLRCGPVGAESVGGVSNSDVSYLILESPVELTGEINPGVVVKVENAPPRSGSARIAAAIGAPMLLREVHSSVSALRSACLRTPLGELGESHSALDPRAAGWVAALIAHRRTDLVTTVRSYLRHRGQWEAAARELSLHRNSLRHRITIATDLIGADLDDPDVASALWLALRAV